MGIKVIISLIPVFLFLVMLLYLDSLKLASKMLLLICLAWGVVSASLSYFLNTFLIKYLGFSFETYSGFIAPFVEEILKMSLLLILIRKNRIGFMIDGAIYGFSIGTTFAFCENLFYLFHFAEAEPNIMENPREAAVYAIRVLKRRWLEAEHKRRMPLTPKLEYRTVGTDFRLPRSTY